MDTIWYRNPSKSEVIGRCGGMKNPNDHTQNRQKSNAKKEKKKELVCETDHYIYTNLSYP